MQPLTSTAETYFYFSGDMLLVNYDIMWTHRLVRKTPAQDQQHKSSLLWIVLDLKNSLLIPHP